MRTEEAKKTAYGMQMMSKIIESLIASNNTLINMDTINMPSRSHEYNADAAIMGAAYSMIMLRAFAAEMALKAISFDSTGGFKKTHDLQELYNELGEDIRDKIEMMAAQQSLDAKQIIANHKDDFIVWRYIWDGENKNITSSSFPDFSKIVDIILSI